MQTPYVNEVAGCGEQKIRSRGRVRAFAGFPELSTDAARWWGGRVEGWKD